VSAKIGWTVAGGVEDVPAAEWDAVVDPDDPFTEHAFLATLERSGSVGKRAGWLPRFVLARQGGRLVGAVPLYLKDNSYGEFIFDWAWASGAVRAGIPYFPKLVAAIPFTPATGSRLLVHPEADPAAVRAALIEGIGAAAEETRASSVHVLFCREEEAAFLAESGPGYHHRLSMQFHWLNREPPYRDFADFLGAFRSRHRKQVRKERSAAAAHGLRFATLKGTELGPREWAALEAFYQSNAAKHGSPTYLTSRFFRLLPETLGHRVLATLAYRDDEPVAGSLNFERGRHLYGRYWGCTEEHERLHFELCYYQLIEHSITRGHHRFEAGAQGEHKLKRGLGPSLTHSAHWLRHPDLARAVTRFIAAEAQDVRERIAYYEQMSPYRKEEEGEE